MTSPAFRKKLESLPDDANASVVGDASSPDEREDAAAAFKARALAFASLRSTAEEQTCLVGLIDALAALAAGERVVFAPSRKDTSGDGFSRIKKHGAPRPKPNKKVDQDLTRDPIEPAFSRCLDAFVEILFLQNTRPLHRAVVSAPRAFPPNARVVFERALSNALRAGIQTARSATSTERSGAARLRVLGVLFSVVSCQPQTAAERRVVRAVAVEAAALIGEGAERARLFFFFFFTPFGALLFSCFLEGRFFPRESEGPVVASRETRFSPRFRTRFPRKTSRFERDEFSFQKLELPSQARTFGAMEPGPLGAVANGFT